MLFSKTKKLVLYLPKDQHKQITLLLEQLKETDPSVTMDDLGSAVFRDFLKEHFSNSNRKLLNKLKNKRSLA